MATDKRSLLENEGNVQNAFPSQLGGHYERVGDKIVLWVWELVWVAWYEAFGLFAKQISSDDDRKSDLVPI